MITFVNFPREIHSPAFPSFTAHFYDS